MTLYLQFIGPDGGIADQKAMPGNSLDEVIAHGHTCIKHNALAHWAPGTPPPIGFMVRDADSKLLHEWPEGYHAQGS